MYLDCVDMFPKEILPSDHLCLQEISLPSSGLGSRFPFSFMDTGRWSFRMDFLISSLMDKRVYSFLAESRLP